MHHVGAAVSDILEWAGGQYLKPIDPDLYRAYLLQIGGSDTLRRYDRTEAYWDRVQIVLDSCFSARERAEICVRLLADGAVARMTEARAFYARALAERRLQGMLRAAILYPTWR
jgi:hypothetical protein